MTPHTEVFLRRGNKEDIKRFHVRWGEDKLATNHTHLDRVHRMIKKLLLSELFEVIGHTTEHNGKTVETYQFFLPANEQACLTFDMKTYFPIRECGSLVKSPQTLNHFNKLIETLNNKTPALLSALIVDIFRNATPHMDSDFVFETEIDEGHYFLGVEHRKRHFNVQISLDSSELRKK